MKKLELYLLLYLLPFACSGVPKNCRKKKWCGNNAAILFYKIISIRHPRLQFVL